MSVTAPMEPRFVERVTVSPPMTRLCPPESFACTVIDEVELPLAVIDAGLGVIVEVAAEAVPTTRIDDEVPVCVPSVAVSVIVSDVLSFVEIVKVPFVSVFDGSLNVPLLLLSNFT